MPATLPTAAECDTFTTDNPRDLEMNAMPKSQDIQWRRPDQPGGNFNGPNARTYHEATVAQLKGELRSVPCDNCQKYPNPGGPFVGCVVVEFQDGRQALGGKCANCHYGRQKCTFNEDSNPPDQGPHCACTDHNTGNACACFEIGKPCDPYFCECHGKCSNVFNDIAQFFQEGGVRATPCFADQVHQAPFECNDENLQVIGTLLWNGSQRFRQVCQVERGLSEWWAEFVSDEVTDEEVYHAQLLRLVRYGLTDSKELSDPGCLKAYYYSFCYGDWLSTRNHWHCLSCKRCVAVGMTHCPACQNCTGGKQICDECGKKKLAGNAEVEDTDTESK